LALIRPALVVLYTAVLGTVAIVLCLIIPGGAAVMPIGRFWSRLVLWTYRVRTTAIRHPAVAASGPAVYVANHQSLFDIPALVVALPGDFRMVAKRELIHIPVFGWALWLAGFPFIDRGNRERAIRSLERAASRIRRGTSIVVFAEGTRSPDGVLLPFKKGGFVLAIQARVPIVPVSIRGGHAILPKGRLGARPGSIEVVFGEPVDTSSYAFESRDALIEVVRRRIAAGLS